MAPDGRAWSGGTTRPATSAGRWVDARSRAETRRRSCRRSRRVEMGSPSPGRHRRRASRPTRSTARSWPMRGRAPGALRQRRSPLGVGANGPQGSGGMSADGGLVCIRHTEHGDIVQQALVVLDAPTAARVAGELDDPELRTWTRSRGARARATTACCSRRSAPGSSGRRSGPRHRRAPGPRPSTSPGRDPLGWWPDGVGDPACSTSSRERNRAPPVDSGSVGRSVGRAPSGDDRRSGGASGRRGLVPTSDSVEPPRVGDADGATVLRAPGRPLRRRERRTARSGWRTRRAPIQASSSRRRATGRSRRSCVVTAAPNGTSTDRSIPGRRRSSMPASRWLLVNYRGSTGYGVAFRQALIGNSVPGDRGHHGRARRVDRRRDRGSRARSFSGWSWGGCLAT